MIHVVCDNARFHDCRAVREFLARHPGRIVLHYLPKYAPETNPIERIWWHLHETITRNHRCRTIDELLSEVYNWAEAQHSFYFQTASFARPTPWLPSADLRERIYLVARDLED